MGRDTEQKVEDRGGEGKKRQRKTSRVRAQSSAEKNCGYREVTERCRYREVPGKRGGSGSRWGWGGLGTASFEFYAQSYPGLPGDPRDITKSSASFCSVRASRKGPKGSPLSDTEVFYGVPDSEANEEKRCRSHRTCSLMHTSPAAIVTRLIGLCRVMDS